MDSIRVDAGQLISFCAEALRQTGLSPDDARVAAEVIVECDMREVSSHGVVALPHYIRQMQKGGIDVKAKLTIEREGPSFALVNANAGVGQLTGYKAAKLAMEKARQAGVGVVAVKNSNHYGAGASYALMCAREGMIGEAFSNAPPTMSITGGRGRNIGNNPYAMAAPAGRHDPVVLDMAMSVVAAGKIVNCAAAGQPIPEGWMLSKDGLPTTNPDDFLAGATQHAGSWWTHWHQWVTSLPGGSAKVPARDPNKGPLKVIEDAPGSYVKFRLDAQKES